MTTLKQNKSNTFSHKNVKIQGYIIIENAQINRIDGAEGKNSVLASKKGKQFFGYRLISSVWFLDLKIENFLN